MAKGKKIFLGVTMMVFGSYVVFGIFQISCAALPGGSLDLPGGSNLNLPGGSNPGSSWSIGNFIKANSFIELVNRIAGFIATIAVAIAVIMIVWSGIMFLTAGGDENKVTTAKRAITWSVIGLAIALIGRGFTTIIQDILGKDVSTAQSVINIFTRVADIMVKVIGPSFAVIFLVWAGIIYMASGGDERKIQDAKKRFWWGIIGTMIVLGVGTIIRTMAYYFG